MIQTIGIVPKALRYTVFERDQFTCRRCGKQPPAVVLRVEQVLAGCDEPAAFITTCSDCQRGIPVQGPAPDHLEWLRTQQEIAEMRDYQAAHQEWERVVAGVIGILQDLWMLVMHEDVAPSEGQLRQWLTLFTPEEVEQAIGKAGERVTPTATYQAKIRATQRALRKLGKQSTHE